MTISYWLSGQVAQPLNDQISTLAYQHIAKSSNKLHLQRLKQYLHA